MLCDIVINAGTALILLAKDNDFFNKNVDW
jgi:hypothetical protein